MFLWYMCLCKTAREGQRETGWIVGFYHVNTEKIVLETWKYYYIWIVKLICKEHFKRSKSMENSNKYVGLK